MELKQLENFILNRIKQHELDIQTMKEYLRLAVKEDDFRYVELQVNSIMQRIHDIQNRISELNIILTSLKDPDFEFK